MFGYINKQGEIFTFDSLEKAREMKLKSVDCSTIQFRPKLDELLAVLKG